MLWQPHTVSAGGSELPVQAWSKALTAFLMQLKLLGFCLQHEDSQLLCVTWNNFSCCHCWHCGLQNWIKFNTLFYRISCVGAIMQRHSTGYSLICLLNFDIPPTYKPWIYDCLWTWEPPSHSMILSWSQRKGVDWKLIKETSRKAADCRMQVTGNSSTVAQKNEQSNSWSHLQPVQELHSDLSFILFLSTYYFTTLSKFHFQQAAVKFLQSEKCSFKSIVVCH